MLVTVSGIFRTSLQEACEALHIPLCPDEICKYVQYASLLQVWNLRINLTSITDEREMAIKHFVDSLACCASGYITPADRIIDVGTGAGFQEWS